MRIIVEIALVLIILMCIWNGYKKGLVMGIGSILAIIISLYMGNLLSDTFSQAAVPAIRPFASGYMEGSEGVINQTMLEILNVPSLERSVDDIIMFTPEIKYTLCQLSFEKLGIHTRTAQHMAQEAVDMAERTGVSISAAMVNLTCTTITYVIGFLIFFSVVLIILTVFGNILNLSFKIPDRDRLNDLGGAVAGLVTGFLFCMVAAWALRFMGWLISDSQLGETGITSLFMKMDLLSVLLGV